MTDQFVFSDDIPPLGWSDGYSSRFRYGPKGAMLTVLPRLWTLPFALTAASVFAGTRRDGRELLSLGTSFLSRVKALADGEGKLIVRSSIVGESIWDRGSYESVKLEATADDFEAALIEATEQVLQSAPCKDVGLVIQRYVSPRARGEFGNLLRISKTRDHWELSTEAADRTTSRTRFNTQRDEAASPTAPVLIKRPRPRVTSLWVYRSLA